MELNRVVRISRVLLLGLPLILTARSGPAADLALEPVLVWEQDLAQVSVADAGGVVVATQDALSLAGPSGEFTQIARAAQGETLHPSENGAFYGVLLHRHGAADLAPTERFTMHDRAGAVIWSIGPTEDVTYRVSPAGRAAGMRLNINDPSNNAVRFYGERGSLEADHLLPHLTGGGFTADGSLFLALSMATGLHAFDAAGRELWTQPDVRLFDASASGEFVAVSGPEWAGLLHDGVLVARIPADGFLIRRVVVAPDGGRFGIAGKHEIRVYRAQDASPAFRIPTGDEAWSFTGLDLAAAEGWCVAGVARDLGEAYPAESRHAEGEVRAYDASGELAHSAAMRFPAWNIWTPTPVLDPSGRGFHVVTRRAVFRTVLP